MSNQLDKFRDHNISREVVFTWESIGGKLVCKVSGVLTYSIFKNIVTVVFEGRSETVAKCKSLEAAKKAARKHYNTWHKS